MDEQTYLELGEAISQLTGRTLARVHPQLGVKVSPCGEVFVPGDKWHKAHWTFGTHRHQGYRQVRIGRKSYLVHRLVAETFLQYPIPQGYQIDHINRDKSDNRAFENLRIVTPSENSRNTPAHDRVTERGGTHKYEDAKKYGHEHQTRYYADNRDKVLERNAQYRAERPEKIRELNAHYYAENKDKVLERQALSYQAKRKTHRVVHFADGKQRWIPIAEAEALLAIPLSQRIYKEDKLNAK